MSIKPESQFISSINKHIPRTEVYRMKNHNSYTAGIPDVWYSAKNDLWVEYKYLPISKPRNPVFPDLSPQQQRWIIDRQEEGRNIWVIVGYKLGGVILKHHSEFAGGLSPAIFKERTLSIKQIAAEILNFVQ